MLPVINLDDENFKGIFEEARQMISGIYPDWTDYNEHDPGITFLELFSWFKEMQQFHMNQIGKDNYLMYLKLLGMRQLKKEPANALITFLGVDVNFELAKRSRLLAGDICFETTDRENLEEGHIVKCISRGKTREAAISEDVLYSGSRMRFYMFGEQPVKGDEFLIKFDKPFEAGKIHSIYFNIYDEYEVKRNLVTEDFIPLAKQSVLYYGEEGWNSCEVVKDETCQMIRSGKLFIKPDRSMQELEGGYFVKIKLEESNYDVPPILQEISLNVLKAVQTDTASEYEDYTLEKNETADYQLKLDSYLARTGIQEVYILEAKGYRLFVDYLIENMEDGVRITFDDLFDGRTGDTLKLRVVNYKDSFGYRRAYETNGFPYQYFELEDTDVFYDSLEIFVESELNPGYYEQWEKADNFSCSSEADRHFVFDEETGIIHFGDGDNGKAPEGNMLIIGYANSLGIRGNVKAGQINHFDSGAENIKVKNKDNAKEGCDKETIEECFKRFIRQFRQINRAITDEDYERIIRSTSGLMIENVKTIPIALMTKRDGSISENCVTIVVKPYSPYRNAILNSAYLENIKKLLDKRRLIGTRINILSPEYIGVTIFVEVAIKPQYLNAYDTVRNAVEDYFKLSDFGKPVLYSEIYGIIDVLDCVSQVRNLSVNSQGKGITRSMNGDLILPANGFVYLKDAQYLVSTAE